MRSDEDPSVDRDAPRAAGSGARTALPRIRDRALRCFDEHRRVLLTLLVLALAILAWLNRFVQDDAFISFRYAENLVRGEGLVWNPGERVEGYTNFLWTLALCVPFLLGIDPVLFSQALGVALFAGSLVLTERIGVAASGSHRVGALAVLLLGTNYSFSAFATGGLETQLQAFWFAAIAVGVLGLLDDAGRWSAVRLAGVSLLAALALLTRLDSAVYLLVAYGVLATKLLAAFPDARTRLSHLGWLTLPGGALLAPWMLWKLAYYGALLPNTYHAKVLSFSDSWRLGLFYLFTFLRSYFLLPLLPIVLFFGWRLRGRALAFLALTPTLWSLYLVRIGGDFMEFRFLVPVLPLALVALAWVIAHGVGSAWLRLACVCVVLAGSVNHALRFDAAPTIGNTQKLEAHLYAPDENWVGIGKALRGAFGGEGSSVVLATPWAGAIPFYSGLRTVDMLGLSDPEIATHGTILDPMRSSPGHSRLATLDQLIERDVNLVIGPPRLVRTWPALDERFDLQVLRHFWIPDATPGRVPASAPLQVLEVPVGEEYAVQVLYLIAHPRVDEAIRTHGFRTHPVARTLPRPRAPAAGRRGAGSR